MRRVCSVCARCVLALGAVVAGRFWCSYAWVSLTQTAPVRPRGCVLACAGVCAGVRSFRRLGGGGATGVAVWRWCGALVVWCAVAPYLFLLIPLFRCVVYRCCACLFCRWCIVCVSYVYRIYIRICFRLFPPLSASLTPLLSISMTIKNVI